MLITYCEKCKNEVPNPSLTAQHKKEVMDSVRAEMPLQAMYILKANGYTELKEAKLFVDHICRTEGKCQSCKYDQLQKEYEICPRCKSLNINWK